MAVIEYDAYKQKLLALEPTLKELEQALNIEPARKELAELQIETEQEGFWNDVERSQRIAQKIKKIVIMGGGYKEVNITPTAEFNFWVDPEAAKIVVDSGCEIVIVPLDATHKAVMSLKDADELEASGKKAAIATASFIRHRQAGYKIGQPMADIDTGPLHDALAVCAVLNEDVLEDVRETYMDIDIAGGAADGMSICDLDKRYPDRKPNVKVALSANREIFSRMIKEIMC